MIISRRDAARNGNTVESHDRIMSPFTRADENACCGHSQFFQNRRSYELQRRREAERIPETEFDMSEVFDDDRQGASENKNLFEYS